MFIILFLMILQLCYCKRERPNIVVVLTDDQDSVLNSMDAMENVRKLVGEQGATFTNSFVNSPICCPSRSTLLTGKYQHNTGVINNSISGNCSSEEWQKRHEPNSFVSLLKTQANYTTFYAGKYLNMYGSKEAGGVQHIPTGYDWWVGLKGNSRYYNYTLSVNGTGRWFTDDYLTDILREYALSFLNQNHIRRQPFFMMIATPACHEPFIPAPRHRDKFPNVKVMKTPSFNYSDNNKHWLIRMPPKYLPADVSVLDGMQKRRFQTLLAVDEMVAEIIDKLKEAAVLDDTYFMFMSDNGYHLGQFVQAWDKRQPYETDIRVPLLIRGPLIKPKRILHLPVSTVDLAPTILTMAGVQPPLYMDGRSFYKGLISGDLTSGDILIEYHGESNINSIDERCPWAHDPNVNQCTLESWCKCQDSRNNTYTCLRRLSPTINFKFCEFSDEENFREAYDLGSDPNELHNIYSELKNSTIYEYVKCLKVLRGCSGKFCHV